MARFFDPPQAKPLLSKEKIDKQGVGIAASAVSIAYAFSKFIKGTLSDRSDARKFLTVGLVIASLVMMSVGFLPFSASNMANLIMVIGAALGIILCIMTLRSEKA